MCYHAEIIKSYLANTHTPTTINTIHIKYSKSLLGSVHISTNHVKKFRGLWHAVGLYYDFCTVALPTELS
jgi:hypothetical protein